FCIDIERKNSLMICSQSKLTRGAQHSFRHCPANLSLLDLESAGKSRPHSRERIQCADNNVRCTAHHIVNYASTRVDLGHPQMIRMMMTFRFADLADDDVGEIAAKCDDIIDRCAAHGEQIAQLHG